MKTKEEKIQEFEKVFLELKAMLHLSDEVMIRLNDKFFESVPVTLVQLNEAIAAADYEALEMFTHSIKGSAGSLRYNAISEIAQDLEKRAHAKEKYTYEEGSALLTAELDAIQECYVLWKEKHGF